MRTSLAEVGGGNRRPDATIQRKGLTMRRTDITAKKSLGTMAGTGMVALALAGAIAASTPALAASAAGYVWPLETPGTITQRFGEGGHTGTDVATAKGTDVLAMADGEVKYVQAWDGHSTSGMQSYGNLVVVYHPSSGTATYYAHLSDYAVYVGQQVRQGQVIGHVGSTGNSTGNHLHVELRTGAKSAHGTYGRSDGRGVDVLDYVSPADTVVAAAPGVLAGRWGEDVTDLTSGPVVIKLNGTNLALTVDGTTKGSEVTVREAEGGNAQQEWTFEPQGDGSYKLRSAAGDIVLDIEAGSTRNGANVWTWVSNAADEERFFVERTSEGLYALRNAKSGLYVNIGDWTQVKDGDGVTLWAGPSADGREADQTWSIADADAEAAASAPTGTDSDDTGSVDSSTEDSGTESTGSESTGSESTGSESEAASEGEAGSGSDAGSEDDKASEGPAEGTDGSSSDSAGTSGSTEGGAGAGNPYTTDDDLPAYDDTHGFGSQPEDSTTDEGTGSTDEEGEAPLDRILGALRTFWKNLFSR